MVDRIDIFRDKVEIHVNIKMDMFSYCLSDILTVDADLTKPAKSISFVPDMEIESIYAQGEVNSASLAV